MDTVYQPSDDSYLLKEAIEESHMRGLVLDMGTGSGILAIAAAKKGCSVTAVDINPKALKLAKENAEKEGVEIKLVLSDLFKEVEGKYGWILFNPPYVPTESKETKDMQSRAWDGGKDGLTVVKEFLKQSKEFLKPKGRILLLVSSNENVVPNFDGMRSKKLKKKSFFFEKLFVLELQR